MLSGVKTKRMVFLVFVNMGVLSAVGGLIAAARFNSATPKAGDGFELDVIAATFVGGASAYGGIGTVAGAVIGALVLGGVLLFINAYDRQQQLGASAAVQQIVEDGKKLYAVVAQVGRRKPILKKEAGEPAAADDPDSECPPPVWERSPRRVPFQPGDKQKLVFSVRSRVIDVVNDAEEPEE